MKKIISFFWKTFLVLIAFVIVLIRGYFFFDQYNLNDTQLIKHFSQSFERVETGYFEYNGRSIHYVDIGNIDDQIVLLVHGSRGSINDWKRFMSIPNIQGSYRFIIVDRLGFGKSGPGKTLTGFKPHSDAYMALLESLGGDSGIQPTVIGHSYGGPIVTKMLIDHSEKLLGGIVAAGAVDPDHQVVYKIQYLLQFPPFRRIIGPMFAGTVDEKLGHIAGLRRDMVGLENITSPVFVVHGTADTLVPYENALYLEERIDPNNVTLIPLPGEQHPLQYNNPEAIAEVLVKHF